MKFEQQEGWQAPGNPGTQPAHQEQGPSLQPRIPLQPWPADGKATMALEDSDFKQLSLASAKEEELLMRLGMLSIQHSELSSEAVRARNERERLCLALEAKYRMSGKKWKLNADKKAIEVL